MTEPTSIMTPHPSAASRHRQALAEIASTSPVCRTLPDGREERCIHCRALIDTAREALGQQPWPAPSSRLLSDAENT
jgi:hypothetical protein